MATKKVTLTYKGDYSSVVIDALNVKINRGESIECDEELSRELLARKPVEWEIKSDKKVATKGGD